MRWAWRAPASMVAGGFAIFSPNDMSEIVDEAPFDQQCLAVVVLLSATPGAAHIAMAAGTITMTVSSDVTLKHPPGPQTLPDEHTMVIPLPDGAYRVFAASNTLNSGTSCTGPVVLGTSDLMQFERVPGFCDPPNQGLVLSAPSPFTDCTLEGHRCLTRTTRRLALRSTTPR
jgi:hypothetical protein